MEITMYIYIYIVDRGFAISPETGVQFQVESYQKLKKLYLTLLCLTLSIIR